MERHQTYPRHVRIAHWVNAVALLAMLWTGFAMLVADRDFGAYVHLVPAGVWNALQLTGHGTQGRAWHLGMAIAFALNALFYAGTSLAHGTWRRIVPRRAWLGEAWTAAVAELTAPRATLERADYNSAQRLAYTLVMAGGTVMVLTGTALWFGKRFPWMLALFGGERIALTIHVVLALSLLAFIAVHLVQVLRAGLPTLLGMITGTTERQPARTRRGLVWTAVTAMSLIAAFSVVSRTSGPSGIPVFLRWAAPAHQQHAERLASARHQLRGKA
jgi:thiosulfate reductase cytochrome b subunit